MGATCGQTVDLAVYTISSGERVLRGQRVNGTVRVVDRPSPPSEGRSFLVESGLTSRRELEALVADYIAQALERDEIPVFPIGLPRCGR